MRQKKRILGLLGVGAILLTSITGCALPEKERYQYIDRVLSDIDYQNIGTIISEEKDDGDGIFAPSFKTLRYDDPNVFEEIAKKLADPEDTVIYEDCEYRNSEQTQMNCSYYGTVVSLVKTETTTFLDISDSSSGRK